MKMPNPIAFSCLGVLTLMTLTAAPLPAVDGWLHWRGPNQNGTSEETGLPAAVGPDNLLWTYDVQGRGSVVTAAGRVYAYGYRGTGPDLQELLVCLDAETGTRQWELGFNDFLSDTVYNRYSIGSPTVDQETGNIYLMTSPGLFVCVSPQGKILWEVSMMERFGLLTFPNGRRGAPVIERDLVIHHGITSYWGADGPARDRFYAFDKLTGQLVWSSTPGVGPQDSSFSSPVVADAYGRRVLYAGTGCGNLVCIDARTGEPLWRFHASLGGMNCTPVLHNNDKLVAIHDGENLDSSEVGRMIAVKLGPEPQPGAKEPVVLDQSYELWRLPLSMFTSSPVLVSDRVYQLTKTGELVCVNAATGELLWQKKLDNSQLHASPLAAEGRLYVPMQTGTLHILKPGDAGAETLDEEKLEGECLGSPTAWNGKLYVHTTEKLYCWGKRGNNPGLVAWPDPKPYPAAGKAVTLQLKPSDILLAPGGKESFRVRQLDAQGFVAGELESRHLDHLESFIPPTARVKATMNATFANGVLTAAEEPVPSAGAFKATEAGLTGLVRGRILPTVPFSEDFESFAISETQPEGHIEAGAKFAYPPLAWIGARLKWEVRELDGNKVLRKTLDNNLFQRATTFFGDENLAGYTLQADVRTDGNRRTKSTVGVINQRYVIALVGNAQILEVSSNHDRVKVSVPFRWDANKWYVIKSRVDVKADGSGVVRGKAWPKGEPEPDTWTIEVPHKVAHRNGSPGVFGFSPQSLFPVYVDNIQVTASK